MKHYTRYIVAKDNSEKTVGLTSKNVADMFKAFLEEQFGDKLRLVETFHKIHAGSKRREDAVELQTERSMLVNSPESTLDGEAVAKLDGIVEIHEKELAAA